MQDSNFTAKMVILDCCRNNPITRSWARTRSVSNGLGEIAGYSLPPSTLIMYAAAPGRVALDGEGDNSPFTEALLKELREPGVSALNAFFNTSDRVIAATGNLQEPWVKFDGSGRAFRKLSFQGELEVPVAKAETPIPSTTAPPKPEVPEPPKKPSLNTLIDWETLGTSMVRIQGDRSPEDTKALLDRGLINPVPDEGSGKFEASGTLIFSGGYIAANFTQTWGLKNLKVFIGENRSPIDATIIGHDHLTDLSLIKVDNENLRCPPIGDSRALEPGDIVTAYRYQESKGHLPDPDVVLETDILDLELIPTGYENYTSTESPSETEDSGSGVFDSNGRLVGLQIARGGKRSGENGFFIPIHHASKPSRTTPWSSEGPWAWDCSRCDPTSRRHSPFQRNTVRRVFSSEKPSRVDPPLPLSLQVTLSSP